MKSSTGILVAISGWKKRAPDGVIEGIEAPGQKFCLGVQWHPEYAISEGDSRIFDAFVAAAAAK